MKQNLKELPAAASTCTTVDVKRSCYYYLIKYKSFEKLIQFLAPTQWKDLDSEEPYHFISCVTPFLLSGPVKHLLI